MNVLIVGLGSIALKHLHVLKTTIPDVNIYALRSQFPSFEIENVTNIYSTDEIDLLDITFVLISNPTSLHFKYIDLFKNKGLPLFIEKPLFAKIDNNTEKLVERIKHNNLVTYIACNLRFLDSLRKIKSLLQNENVNEVNVYCGSYLPDWRPDKNYREVYSANKEMGGGVHIDLIHELDYIYWLFGKPVTTHSMFRNQSTLNITAYDYANYLWNYNNFTANIVLNYYRRDSKRTFEIVCERGTYIVNLLQNSISFNGEIIFKSKQKISDTYKDQMQFFINEVLKKHTPFNTIVQANEVLKLCLTD